MLILHMVAYTADIAYSCQNIYHEGVSKAGHEFETTQKSLCNYIGFSW